MLNEAKRVLTVGFIMRIKDEGFVGCSKFIGAFEVDRDLHGFEESSCFVVIPSTSTTSSPWRDTWTGAPVTEINQTDK